jgi:hypothetical protein
MPYPLTVSDQGGPAVGAGIQELLDSWTTIPALVRDERLVVVASNRLARALSPSFAPGTDLARYVFTEPTVLANPEWRGLYRQVASSMRELASRHDEQQYFDELGAEISAENEHFSTLWNSEIDEVQSTEVLFEHSEVGAISATYRAVALEGRAGLTLISWHAVQDSRSREAMRKLVALTAAAEKSEQSES